MTVYTRQVDKLQAITIKLAELDCELERLCMLSPQERHEPVQITISRGDIIPVTVTLSSLSEALRHLNSVIVAGHMLRMRGLLSDLSGQTVMAKDEMVLSWESLDEDGLPIPPKDHIPAGTFTR